MFLAIDRVSKFTYVEFYDSAGLAVASSPRRRLAQGVRRLRASASLICKNDLTPNLRLIRTVIADERQSYFARRPSHISLKRRLTTFI